MGLSPELQEYAENIWRRFPEVFISLGSPYVDEGSDDPDGGVSPMRQRCWHRIVRTGGEKVIEIILPDSDADADGSSSSAPFEFMADSTQQLASVEACAAGNGNAGEQECQNGTTPESHYAMYRKAKKELEQLNQEITRLHELIPSLIGREVHAQLADQHRSARRRRSKDIAEAEDAKEDGAHSDATMVSSAPSSLAERRGKSITPVKTRKRTFGSPDVRRLPDGMAAAAARGLHLDSPGAQIQQCAALRRQQRSRGHPRGVETNAHHEMARAAALGSFDSFGDCLGAGGQALPMNRATPPLRARR